MTGDMWVLAVTDRNDGKRGANITVNVFTDEASAFAALRDDWAQAFRDAQMNMPEDDDVLLSVLRWDFDVIATVAYCRSQVTAAA